MARNGTWHQLLSWHMTSPCKLSRVIRSNFSTWLPATRLFLCRRIGGTDGAPPAAVAGPMTTLVEEASLLPQLSWRGDDPSAWPSPGGGSSSISGAVAQHKEMDRYWKAAADVSHMMDPCVFSFDLCGFMEWIIATDTKLLLGRFMLFTPVITASH